MKTSNQCPAVGLGYRAAIDNWTRDHLDHFDVLEITVDHCIGGGRAVKSAIFDLVGRIPLTAHGIGLSIGTDVPLDFGYLDQVAAVVERLEAPAYSEHLAFTRSPGRDLANLLPLPKTEAVAEPIIAKVRTVQSRVPVPFLLENITYLFEWPDSDMSDAEFLNLICRETGAGLLLDIENLYLNSSNHGFDPYEFLDALPGGLVQEVHVAGGVDRAQGLSGAPVLRRFPFASGPRWRARSARPCARPPLRPASHRARARRSARRRRMKFSTISRASALADRCMPDREKPMTMRLLDRQV